MLSLSMMLVVQHWLIILLGTVAMIIIYLGIIEADKSAMEKFGQDYIRYMQRVPQINFIAGINRFFRYKMKKINISSFRN